MPDDPPAATPPLTLTPEQVQAVLQLRATVNQVAQALRQGDPLRSALIEALFAFQLTAPRELCP